MGPAAHGGLLSWDGRPEPAPAALQRSPGGHGLWWVGIGTPAAPVDLLVATVGLGADSRGRWPQPRGTVSVAVLASWATIRGAEIALDAATQHARGELVSDAALAGLVVVELPGKTPREIRRRLDQVESILPAVWRIPWEPAWVTDRLEDDCVTTAPLGRLRDDLAGVLTAPSAGPSGPQTV
jgi:hypothetical protein